MILLSILVISSYTSSADQDIRDMLEQNSNQTIISPQGFPDFGIINPKNPLKQRFDSIHTSSDIRHISIYTILSITLLVIIILILNKRSLRSLRAKTMGSFIRSCQEKGYTVPTIYSQLSSKGYSHEEIKRSLEKYQQ